MMKFDVLSAAGTVALLWSVGGVQAAPALVPMPVRADFHAAQAPYMLRAAKPDITVAADENATTAASILKDYLGDSMKLVDDDVASRTIDITMKTKPQPLAAIGAYSLRVTDAGIAIEADEPDGMRYAVQTLRQLMPPVNLKETTAPISVPAVTIEDAPYLNWRGLMLDCARQYYTVERIEQLLDAMALLKMNRFHWHLIDGNAWRLQSDKYPKLTEMGAWRGPKDHRYGGVYTKDDVRHVVAYAQRLGIEVMPEFEMPGHSDAILQSMPELSCVGTPYTLPDETTAPLPNNSLRWYYLFNDSRPLCAGNDDVFKFYADIFDEFLPLFPFKYWHVGGDERPEGRWSKCPKCLARMKEHNLADEHALQEWFMREMSNRIAARGKTAVSWAVTRTDQYAPKDLDDLGNDAVLMSWHDSTKFAATHNRPVINAANRYLYFDYPPFKNYPGWERGAWMPIITLEEIYKFKAVPDGLTPEQRESVMGAQCCVWTETLPQDEFFEWTFPRVPAAAEMCWKPAADRKDLDGFLKRIDAIEPLFNSMGIKFGHAPDAKK